MESSNAAPGAVNAAGGNVIESPGAGFNALTSTIASRLCAQPELCAIRFRGTSISNAELLHAIVCLSDILRAAGIVHGTRVAVCLERSPMTVAMMLALWTLRAAYVPLDPALPRERLFAMCTAAGVDLVITEPTLNTVTKSLPCALLMLDPVSFAPGSRDVAFRVMAAPGDLAYVVFTSGSSGAPKGVRITQGNLATHFAGILPLLDLPQGFRMLACANVGFDIAFLELLAPLLCGGTLVFADSAACASPSQLLELIEREIVNVVQATPSLWQLLTAQEWTTSLAVALAGGEALLRGTAEAILQRAACLWNLYGPTECTIWASAHRVTANDLRDAAPAVISIGSALPGYRLQLDANGDDDADAAELIISGPAVSPGYCMDVANEAFRVAADAGEYRYYSGDLCRRDARGLLHYVGRRDSQVKHNGYRIELDEISLLLQQHMSIRRAACLVRPASSSAPSLLFACVEFRAGVVNRNKDALNAWLADYLPAWMLPQRYFFMEQLPLNANGKLDRAVLLALAEPAPVSLPDDSLEARVTAVFCEVLEIERIGACDSFLDAGGTSMLAATLVMTLNERLNSKLSLRDVLATPPTVARVVHMLHAASAARAAS